jgi:hypothetical protein
LAGVVLSLMIAFADVDPERKQVDGASHQHDGSRTNVTRKVADGAAAATAMPHDDG